MNFYFINPDAEHRGILLIKDNFLVLYAISAGEFRVERQ